MHLPMRKRAAAGTLTIPELRNASRTTPALRAMHKIPPETDRLVPEPPDPVSRGVSAAADDAPASEAPAEEAEELLYGLLAALHDDAWSALAAAVPDELAGRLRRYLGEGQSENRRNFRAGPR